MPSVMDGSPHFFHAIVISVDYVPVPVPNDTVCMVTGRKLSCSASGWESNPQSRKYKGDI